MWFIHFQEDAVAMDSLANTTNSALIKYFNVIRKRGYISLNEKYKLLVLWFLNYLKHTSDFTLEYVIDEVASIQEWRLNTDLLREIDNVFNKNMFCLETDTCTIRFQQGDCTQTTSRVDVVNVDVDEFVHLLMSNDSALVGTTSDQPIGTMSLTQAVGNQQLWEQNSFFLFQNGYDNSNNDTERFLSYHTSSI